MIVAASLSLLVLGAQSPVVVAPVAPARVPLEYAVYDVGDLLRLSGAAAARETELVATREFGERAWRWLGSPALKMPAPEPFVVNASAPGVVALAASAERHDHYAAFLSWQRDEQRDQSFALAVYTCEESAASALGLEKAGQRALLATEAGADADSVVQQVRRACGDKLDVLACPTVVTRGIGRATIATATEHEFVVDAVEEGGKVAERHRTVKEGVAIEASAVKLAQGQFGIDLTLETTRLLLPVRTAPSKLKRADGTPIELSLPETERQQSRVALVMKPGATLLWRTGLEGASTQGLCTLVSLRFDSKPAPPEAR